MRSLRAISASRGSRRKEYTVNSKEHLTRGEDSFYLDLTGYSTPDEKRVRSRLIVNRNRGRKSVRSGKRTLRCGKSKQVEIRKESTRVVREKLVLGSK